MKKIFLCLMFVFVGQFAFSQQIPDWQKRIKMLVAVDSLIKNYEYYMSLSDDNARNSFLKLFEGDAKVFDDLNPTFFDDPHQKKPFKFMTRNIVEYIAKTKTDYPDGMTRAKISNININYGDIDNNIASAVIEKTIRATSSSVLLWGNQWDVKIVDTVFLSIKVNKDYSYALIEQISGSSANFNITNDDDGDLVANEVDNCRTRAGYVKFHGCQPPEGHLLGLNLNAGPILSKDIISPPNENSSWYGATGVNIPKLSLGYTAGAELELFIGRNRHFGLGFGAMYAHSEATVDINSYDAKFVATDGNNVKYIQEVDNTNYKSGGTYQYNEALKFNYIMLPLTLKVKTQINDKIGLKLSAGFSYPILIKGTSQIGAKNDVYFNYEAYYEDDGNRNPVSVSGVNDISLSKEPITYNYYITQTDGSYNKVVSDFDALRNKVNYNVGIAQKVSSAPEDITNKFNRADISLIIKPQLTYALWGTNYLNLGFIFIYQLNTTNSAANGYHISDSPGTYNSIVNATNTYKNIYFGISVGISLGIIKGFADNDVY